MLQPNYINQEGYILQNIPFGVLIEDSNRKIHSANQEFINIFSIPLTADQLVGLDCALLAQQSKSLFINQNFFLNFVANCIEQKEKTGPIEFELIDQKFIQISYIPFYQNEEFYGHSWCYNDISKEKSSYIDNKKQKKFYETILNAIPADIAIFNPDHSYIFLNKYAVKDENLRKWLIGKNDYDYCKEKNRDTNLADLRSEKFNEMRLTQQSVSWEDTIKDKEGKETTVLRIFHPYVEANNQLKYVIGYGIDLTDFKRKDLMLKEEEQKSLALIKELKEVIFSLDDNGKILNLNPAWLTLTGYSQEKTINQNFSKFLDINEHKETLKAFLNDKLKKEITFITKIKTNNNFKWVEISVFRKFGLITPNDYLWGTIIDIDGKIKAQEQLINLVKKERELNELKSGFVNMVSHEVRTPLAGILSSVELLELYNHSENEVKNQKSAIHYERIKDQILRIGDLMNNVLLLGKLDAGKIKLNLQKLCLVEYLNNFINSNYLDENDYPTLKLKITGEPILMRFDLTLMNHVLTNIIGNAFKYSQGSKYPEIQLIYHSEKIEFLIKDFGIGIPKIDIPKLFIAFNRASNVKNIEGTGLGLMLAKHFIELHSGTIKVSSKLNIGSLFTITLPCL